MNDGGHTKVLFLTPFLHSCCMGMCNIFVWKTRVCSVFVIGSRLLQQDQPCLKKRLEEREKKDTISLSIVLEMFWFLCSPAANFAIKFQTASFVRRNPSDIFFWVGRKKRRDFLLLENWVGKCSTDPKKGWGIEGNHMYPY